MTFEKRYRISKRIPESPGKYLGALIPLAAPHSPFTPQKTRLWDYSGLIEFSVLFYVTLTQNSNTRAYFHDVDFLCLRMETGMLVLTLSE